MMRLLPRSLLSGVRLLLRLLLSGIWTRLTEYAATGLRPRSLPSGVRLLLRFHLRPLLGGELEVGIGGTGAGTIIGDGTKPGTEKSSDKLTRSLCILTSVILWLHCLSTFSPY